MFFYFDFIIKTNSVSYNLELGRDKIEKTLKVVDITELTAKQLLRKE